MNSIAQGYAHLYHTVPEQLGPKTTRAAVVASLVTTVALAVLYPLGTSLAVGAFLAGGVASYFWAQRRVAGLITPSDSLKDKVNLVFRVVSFPTSERYSILQFGPSISQNMPLSEKASLLNWIHKQIPSRERACVSESFSHFSDKALSFQTTKTLLEALWVLADVDPSFFAQSAPQIIQLLPYSPPERQQGFVLAQIIGSLSSIPENERSGFIDQIFNLLPLDNSSKSFWHPALIQALTQISVENRESFINKFIQSYTNEVAPALGLRIINDLLEK